MRNIDKYVLILIIYTNIKYLSIGGHVRALFTLFTEK